ncbi:MAG TPA: signal peptidase I [Actinomycetota bacterium]|nr:signal peptidase I [Actinomycetota bacterium]
MSERPPALAEPAEEAPPRVEQRGLLPFLRELPGLVLLALLLALLLKSFVVQAFYIPSGSMEPTLFPGDRVLVNRLAYRFGDPARGDVIVFDTGGAEEDRGVVGRFLRWLSEGLGVARPTHEDYIKRVIGLPGEVVEIRRGVVYVDGEPIPEPWLAGRADRRSFAPVEVPEGMLYVLGDNRLHSGDSRFGLGFVPIDRVVGKAFLVVWPPSRVGWIR